MKVLMVNKFLYPNGGSETYIFEVGKQLEKMGHEVQYFGMEHEDRIVGNRAESYTSNMDFHTGKLGKLLYPFKIIYSTEARKKIRRVLEDFRPDVVHLNNFNFQLTPSIIYEIKKYKKQNKKNVKLIFTAHDYQIVCPNHMMRVPSSGENCERCLNGGFRECIKYNCIHNSRIKSILGSIEGWLYQTLQTYRYIDCIICPSYFMENKLKSNCVLQDKTVVMHNFVNATNCLAGNKKDYVIYFGRYAEEKGIRTLLNACKKLPEVSFVFAGSGPLEQEVNQVENIVNVGFLKGKELETLIGNAAFSIYPSEWFENCPFSVMESIAYGTPVIGANIGGIPELIVEGVTGELFYCGDVDSLCDKIYQFWNDKKKLSEYTQNCMIKRFDSVEEYCKKLILLYQGEN
ncbi:glycosyltransferase family 4 protein [Eisenbergiella sp.]